MEIKAWKYLSINLYESLEVSNNKRKEMLTYFLDISLRCTVKKCKYR